MPRIVKTYRYGKEFECLFNVEELQANNMCAYCTDENVCCQAALMRYFRKNDMIICVVAGCPLFINRNESEKGSIQ